MKRKQTKTTGTEKYTDMEPHLRNTKITCEWRYPWSKTAVCGTRLTPAEVKFCDNTDEFTGAFYCYGHQKQFKELKTK